MTNDIDLARLEHDALVANDDCTVREPNGTRTPAVWVRAPELLSLIAAVRSERARSEKAEQGSAYWNRRFAEEHARALAAEAELDSLRTLQETTMDALRVTAEERNAAEPFMRAFDGVSAEYASKGASTVGYPQIIKALDRLAAHLRAQDEPKRIPPFNGYPWMRVGPEECVECPGCGFTFAAKHEDMDGGYSCPDPDCGTVERAPYKPEDEPKPCPHCHGEDGVHKMSCYHPSNPRRRGARFSAVLKDEDEPKREPPETRTCRLCNGEPIAPWPPVPGGGPTHHTCHPGEERKREPGGSSR